MAIFIYESPCSIFAVTRYTDIHKAAALHLSDHDLHALAIPVYHESTLVFRFGKAFNDKARIVHGITNLIYTGNDISSF